jgi:hypothetical protein
MAYMFVLARGLIKNSFAYCIDHNVFSKVLEEVMTLPAAENNLSEQAEVTGIP